MGGPTGHEYPPPCFTFIVSGKPQPKQRARVTRRGTFTPTKTDQYESRVASAAHTAWKCRPMLGPVRVDLLIVLKRPDKLHRRADPDGRMWAPVRPDADNIRKAVLDGMCKHKMIAVIKDDGQVVAGSTTKVYGGKGERPHVVVEVSALREYGPGDEGR